MQSTYDEVTIVPEKYTQDEIYAFLATLQDQGRLITVEMRGTDILSVKVYATSPYLEAQAAKMVRGPG